MSLVFSGAVASDAPAIGAILNDWIDEADWMVRVHAPGEYPGFGALLVASCEVTIAREQGRLVGFLAVQGADIQALYVVADARGRGVGRALLARAKAGAQALGLWVYQANAAARAFYRRHGFVEDALGDGRGNDERMADVHLSWARDV